jgi:hypothetical protein
MYILRLTQCRVYIVSCVATLRNQEHITYKKRKLIFVGYTIQVFVTKIQGDRLCAPDDYSTKNTQKYFNPYPTNVIYISRTALLASRRYILYI